MSDNSPDLEVIIAQAILLSPLDKVRLVERVMAGLKLDLLSSSNEPRRSIYGIFAHLSPAPSAETIDEVRREVWTDFPRKDI